MVRPTRRYWRAAPRAGWARRIQLAARCRSAFVQATAHGSWAQAAVTRRARVGEPVQPASGRPVQRLEPWKLSPADSRVRWRAALGQRAVPSRALAPALARLPAGWVGARLG